MPTSFAFPRSLFVLVKARVVRILHPEHKRGAMKQGVFDIGSEENSKGRILVSSGEKPT